MNILLLSEKEYSFYQVIRDMNHKLVLSWDMNHKQRQTFKNKIVRGSN